jgi:hypothetical protein
MKDVFIETDTVFFASPMGSLIEKEENPEPVLPDLPPLSSLSVRMSPVALFENDLVSNPQVHAIPTCVFSSAR